MTYDDFSAGFKKGESGKSGKFKLSYELVAPIMTNFITEDIFCAMQSEVAGSRHWTASEVSCLLNYIQLSSEYQILVDRNHYLFFESKFRSAKVGAPSKRLELTTAALSIIIFTRKMQKLNELSNETTGSEIHEILSAALGDGEIQSPGTMAKHVSYYKDKIAKIISAAEQRSKDK